MSGLLENQQKYILNFWYECTEKCTEKATVSFVSQIYQGKVVYFISELEFGDFRAKNWGFFASKESLELVGMFLSISEPSCANFDWLIENRRKEPSELSLLRLFKIYKAK